MVFLVRNRTNNEYADEIAKDCRQNIFQCSERIKHILETEYDDIDLVHKNEIMSIKCPLTLSLIDTPIRGKNCNHINCFDLKAYAQINKTTTVKKWMCPICGIPS